MVKIHEPKGPFPHWIKIECVNEDCDQGFFDYNIGWDKVHVSEHVQDCPSCGVPIHFKIKLVPIAIDEEIKWSL